MHDIPRGQLLMAAIVLVLAVGVGGRLTGEPSRPAPPSAPLRVQAEAEGGGASGRIVVHVAGAVRRPGVYRLRPGLRVDDAVQRAGGALRRADLSALNLAAELEDGRQVVVPLLHPRGGPAPAGGSPGAVAGAGAAPDAPINLNTATLEQLDTLEGIGPTTAQKILDWRTENGGFGSVEELGQIPGIGEKRMATLRARVTL